MKINLRKRKAGVIFYWQSFYCSTEISLSPLCPPYLTDSSKGSITNIMGESSTLCYISLVVRNMDVTRIVILIFSKQGFII